MPTPKATLGQLKVLVFAPGPSLGSIPQGREGEQRFPQADLTVVEPAQSAWLLGSATADSVDWIAGINWLRRRQFNAAIILTAPGQSPYTLGYLCYLADIPIRIGYSVEFGGQVLSHCLPPTQAVDWDHLGELLQPGTG